MPGDCATQVPLLCPHCGEAHFLGALMISQPVPFFAMATARVYCAGCLTPFTWDSQQTRWHEMRRGAQMKEA